MRRTLLLLGACVPLFGGCGTNARSVNGSESNDGAAQGGTPSAGSGGATSSGGGSVGTAASGGAGGVSPNGGSSNGVSSNGGTAQSSGGGTAPATGGAPTATGGRTGSGGSSSGASGGSTSTFPPDSGAPAGSFCKRGVAYGFDPSGAVSDLTALSSGVTWFYNWASTPPSGLVNDYARLGVEYVPMVWGGTFDVTKLEQTIPQGAKYLLGFNEPNFNSQANLTPTQAAALWPQLEQIAANRNLKLVSPAVNYCGGGCNVTNPVDWMDQFLAACTNCQVDYIAIHWYACYKSALSSYVADFKKYNRPIWLTEFSCGDSGTQPVSMQESYMKDALDYLENDPDIFRYSWFSGRTTAIANVDLLGSPGQLTDLGKEYTTLPDPGTCGP